MTKTYYTIDASNTDPENGPFYTIHHKRKPMTPKEKYQHENKVKRNLEFMREVNRNPVTKYMYEKEFNQRLYARRLGKTVEWGDVSMEKIMSYIRANWNNSEEPTLLGSNSFKDENYTTKMTFRGQLKNARSLRKTEINAENGNFEQRKFDHAFVETVKAARNKLELTQEELAKLLNRPISEISQFENHDLPFNGEFKDLLTNQLLT